MCTVSWVHEPGGYHLLVNRDEKRTRSEGLPPRIEECGGVRFMAPTDGDCGGTWVAVNEFGVAACLLNGLNDGRRAWRSRGFVVRELITGGRIGDVDVEEFAPFTVVMLQPGAQATVAEWDGRELKLDAEGDARMPLVSSSFDADGVRAARRQEFRERIRQTGRLDEIVLRDFHRSHGPERGAYSPCMHREDAETVSFSWVSVSPEEVRFRYEPSSPCTGARRNNPVCGVEIRLDARRTPGPLAESLRHERGLTR